MSWDKQFERRAWLSAIDSSSTRFTAMRSALAAIVMRLAMLKRDNRIQQFSYIGIERQIRIESSLAVSTFVRDALGAIARWLRIFVLRSVRLVRDLAAERSRRKAVVELQRFDDRSLADMGVTRGEIEFAVRNGRPRHLGQAAEVRSKQPSPAKAAA
jgi:uncharacterized protein YjiS (DUF1127 family)